MIIIAKEHHHKVKDALWALPKVVASVQKSSLNHRVQCRSNSTAWIIYGFQNTDKVSCYANAVLQCLLHLNVIRQQLFNCDKSDILRLLMHRYEIGMHNLNTYAIRQYLEHFLSIIKHNAFDFLITLCEKYECIKNLMEHQITCTKRCKTCDYTKTTHNNNIIISIPVNNLKKKNFNLNDLLNITFSHWYQSHNESCEYCTGNDIIYKNEITLTKEIIVIHLILFLSQDDKLMKTTSEFNLRAVPTTKVLIAGQSYKTMNAIFHHGSSINEGHYVSICREGRSSIWVEVDDMQVKKRQWPRGAKDVSIIFLQMIASK